MLSRIIESAPPAASDPKPITMRGRKVIRARHPMELLRYTKWNAAKLFKKGN